MIMNAYQAAAEVARYTGSTIADIAAGMREPRVQSFIFEVGPQVQEFAKRMHVPLAVASIPTGGRYYGAALYAWLAERGVNVTYSEFVKEGGNFDVPRTRGRHVVLTDDSVATATAYRKVCGPAHMKRRAAGVLGISYAVENDPRGVANWRCDRSSDQLETLPILALVERTVDTLRDYAERRILVLATSGDGFPAVTLAGALEQHHMDVEFHDLKQGFPRPETLRDRVLVPMNGRKPDAVHRKAFARLGKLAREAGADLLDVYKPIETPGVPASGFLEGLKAMFFGAPVAKKDEEAPTTYMRKTWEPLTE